MKRMPGHQKSKTFHLSFHADVGASCIPFLRRNLRKAHAILQIPLIELSVALVNDKRMSSLHERFMNVSGPTDVLTFPLDVDAAGQAISGEIAICVPYARRCAREQGVTFQNELLLYALHGMLHLAGLDDRTAAQFNRMHRIEDDILGRLGVGPVFNQSAPAPGRARGER